ncbi:M18 family aminopeptidase [bacterium]|nr:M18 family aminopeptidase [bacterium]
MAIEITDRDIQISQELCDFIQACPSMFHTNRTIRDHLERAGFTYLPESATWEVTPGGRYYTVRNNSSLVAFRVGGLLDDYHFQMAAAHGDSPTYKIKGVPELEGPDGYLRLDVEAYGGMIDGSWLDRPLGVAGRVLVQEGDAVRSRLVHVDRDLLVIPSLAIHMNREVNKGYEFNRQRDLCPLFSAGALGAGAFDAMLAEELGVEPGQVLGRDLFLVSRVAPRVWGWRREFVSAPRLDDLQCAFAALRAFLAADNPHDVSVYACFDNEEVGSNTKQGAMSTLLHDTLARLNAALGRTAEDYYRAVARSMMVSCDNAHAIHPNRPDVSDEANHARLNGGVVVKEAANQLYTTDAFSRALFTGVCRRAGVPVQAFANRSDMRGGSTLGNLSNTQVSVHCVDIGLPQLAMHSSWETCGAKDTAYGIDALTAFYATNLVIEGADVAELR